MVAQPVLALVPTPPALTEVPPLAPQPIVVVGSSAALTLSVSLPLTLLGLIRNIHGDFGCILRRFDCLEKKVESMDQRLIHIEGIVDPTHALAPRVGLDILASEDDDEDEESDEDA